MTRGARKWSAGAHWCFLQDQNDIKLDSDDDRGVKLIQMTLFSNSHQLFYFETLSVLKLFPGAEP